MEYGYSFAELIDRMIIVELKIIHSDTQEKKEAFQKEMGNILADLSQYSKNAKDANIIRAACALAMINITIWSNEDGVREAANDTGMSDAEKIKLADRLLRTHRLNFDRSSAKAAIQRLTGGRLDEKLNYISGLWNIKY